MTTILIDLTTNRAIRLTNKRNCYLREIDYRLGMHTQRVADSLEQYPDVELVGEYSEDSPELAGIWFDDWRRKDTA